MTPMKSEASMISTGAPSRGFSLKFAAPLAKLVGDPACRVGSMRIAFVSAVALCDGKNFLRIARILVAASLALWLPGCATVGLAVIGAVGGAGVSAGVDHTLNGIVYKTFAAPLNNVRFAVLRTFDRMDMPLTADERSDEGWKLSATATDRTIDVDLQKLTDTTTRMRVVANEGEIFFKDASTATAIVLQTAQTLDSDAKAAPERSRAKATSELVSSRSE